jgi:hypothetical protein
MIRKTSILLGIAMAAVMGGAGVSAAMAAGGPTAPVAAVSEGGTAFYSQQQIPQAWAAATAAVPEPLPPGATYPKDAPGILKGDGTSNNEYEVGLPEEIATRYWRCAWIDSALRGGGDQAQKSKTMLSNWESFPAVKNFHGLSGYETKMSSLARRLGKSEPQTEFQLDCGIGVYNPGGSN